MGQYATAAWKQYQAKQQYNLNPSTNVGGYLSSGGSSSSSSKNIFGVDAGPAPAAPDYAKLEAAGRTPQIDEALAKSMSDYDALSASTAAIGFQGANNAGNVYANRLMQQGINPVASGVVAAQAKLPVFKQLADINKEKSGLNVDTKVKAASLAANIAQTVAQLQMSYASTLADFNIKKAGLSQNAQELSATNDFRNASLGLDREKLGLSREQLGMERELNAAKIAAMNADTRQTSLTTRNQNRRWIPHIQRFGSAMEFGPADSGGYFQDF